MRRRTWTPYTNSRPLPRRPREDEGVAWSRQRLQLCNCGHARRRQVSFCLCSLMRVIFDIEITQIPRTSQFFDLYQFIRELSILSRMKWVHQIPCVSHPPDRENRVPHEAVPVGFVVKYPALKCSRNSDGFIQRSDSFFILGGLPEEGFSIRRSDDMNCWLFIRLITFLDPNGQFERTLPFMAVPGAPMITKAEIPKMTVMTTAWALNLTLLIILSATCLKSTLQTLTTAQSDDIHQIRDFGWAKMFTIATHNANGAIWLTWKICGCANTASCYGCRSCQNSH